MITALPLLATETTPAPATAPSVTVRPFLPETAAWKSQRILQADAKGNLFLLRVSDLSVVPVSSVAADEPQPLRHLGMEPPGFALDAAMGGDAGTWAVLVPGELHLFRRGKQVNLLQPPWQAVATGFVRGELTAALSPLRRVSLEAKGVPQQPPLAATYDGKRWSSLVEAAPRPAVAGMDAVHSVMANNAVRLVADGKALWMVDEYAYRLRRFRADGYQALELVVGTGVVEKEEAAAEVSEEQVARQGFDAKRVRVNSFPARRVVHGGAAAPDGRFYLLVSPESGGAVSLDRFDDATGTVERIALATDVQGRVSMAAGGEGLFFMPQAPSGHGGWLAWHELEEADWQPVEDVSLDGQAPTRDPSQTPAPEPVPPSSPARRR